MKTKYFKIVVSVLTVAAVITLYMSIRKKTNWDVLMKENIEALTTLEADDSSNPCVTAKGYCIIDGVCIYGIALEK